MDCGADHQEIGHMKRIEGAFRSRVETSEIYVGSGVLSSFGPIMSRCFHRGKVVLIEDSRLQNGIGRRVASSLSRSGWEVSRKALPAGEGAKSLGVLKGLYDHLIRSRADRHT